MPAQVGKIGPPQVGRFRAIDTCPEEVAFGQGFIDRAQLERLGLALGKSDYARYVTSIALES